jgi:hypothetical protein
MTTTFIRSLEGLLKFLEARRAKKMGHGKFVTWLEKIGRDFEKGFTEVAPYVEDAGEAAVALFIPKLSPLFNQTVSAVITAEQSAAAAGQQSGTGTQKLGSVVQLMGPLIKQVLTDVGKPADDAAVENYINAIVTILNAVPAPASAATSTAPAAPAAGAASGN